MTSSFIGTVVAGVTKATKIAKVGNIIGKSLQMAGKAYMTVETAKNALELAGNARMEYAINGGKMTLGVAAKAVGAVAMEGLSVLSAGSLCKDVTSLSKVGDVSLNTNGQKAADTESGRCAKGDGIGCFVAGTRVKTQDGGKTLKM